MANRSVFVGKNKHFLQIFSLCFILFGLFAGVIIVSNKEAVLKEAGASKCVAAHEWCLNYFNQIQECCSGYTCREDMPGNGYWRCYVTVPQCTSNDKHFCLNGDVYMCQGGELFRTTDCVPPWSCGVSDSGNTWGCLNYTVPENCGRCSNNYPCRMATWVNTNPDGCITVQGTPSYLVDNSCTNLCSSRQCISGGCVSVSTPTSAPTARPTSAPTSRPNPTPTPCVPTPKKACPI